MSSWLGSQVELWFPYVVQFRSRLGSGLRLVGYRLGLWSSLAFRTGLSFGPSLGRSLRLVSGWLGFRPSFASCTRFALGTCLLGT